MGTFSTGSLVELVGALLAIAVCNCPRVLAHDDSAIRDWGRWLVPVSAALVLAGLVLQLISGFLG